MLYAPQQEAAIATMKTNTLTIMAALSLGALIHGTTLAQPSQPPSSRCFEFAGLRGGFSVIHESRAAFDLKIEYSGTVCGDPTKEEWRITGHYQRTGGRDPWTSQFKITSTPDQHGLLRFGQDGDRVMFMVPEIRVFGGASPRMQLTLRPLPAPGFRVTPRPLAWVPLERSTQCACKRSPCGPETGFTFDKWRDDPELRTEVGEILGRSETWKRIYNELKPKIMRGAGAEFSSDTLGVSGALPDGTGYAMWLNFEGMTSRFEIANVMAHETGHLKKNRQKRGFWLADAAPLVREPEYVVLRWVEERDATETESKILREIRASPGVDAALAACHVGLPARDLLYMHRVH